MENAALYQQERMQISVDQWVPLVVWRLMSAPAIQKLHKYIHKVKTQFRTCFSCSGASGKCHFYNSDLLL